MLIMRSRINLILNVFRKALTHMVTGGWMKCEGSDVAVQRHGNRTMHRPGWAINSWLGLALGSPWPGRAGLGEAGDQSSCCTTGAGWGEPWGMTWAPGPMGSMEWALGSHGTAAKAGRGPEKTYASVLTLDMPSLHVLILLTRGFCLRVFKEKAK